MVQTMKWFVDWQIWGYMYKKKDGFKTRIEYVQARDKDSRRKSLTMKNTDSTLLLLTSNRWNSETGSQ